MMQFLAYTVAISGNGRGTNFEGHSVAGWYVFVHGKQLGPVPEDLLKSAFAKHDRSGVYVWRHGFEDWKLLSEVSELSLPPPPPLPPSPPRPPLPPLVAPRRESAEVKGTYQSRKKKWFKAGAAIGFVLAIIMLASGQGSSADPTYLVGFTAGCILFFAICGLAVGAIGDVLRRPSENKTVIEVQSNARKGNIVARHWRGDLPLWVSFWIVVVVGNIGLTGLASSVGAICGEVAYNPWIIFGALASLWSFATALVIWQLVGVWRSANRYTEIRARAGKRALWAGLAQVVVIIGAITNLGTIFKVGVPQLAEASRISFQNDPDIPNYSFRVMRDGTEAEIVGGFKYGLTDDFAKILGAARQVKVVHLDSVGGRLGEGEKMFNLIRKRGLDTYVSSKCLSACTLAFAGGRKRYLNTHAVLGFHKGAFPGLDEDETDSIQRRVFVSAGYDEDFISKALSTSNSDMWKPPPEVLLRARVVTAFVDGNKFASSGFGEVITKEKIGENLEAAGPVFKAIKTRYPAEYDAITEGYTDSILKGKTESETIEVLRAKLLPFIRSLLPLADDDVLAEYAGVIADQYRDLYSSNPSLCYAYASGEGGVELGAVSKAVAQRERLVEERVVQTARERPSADKHSVETLLARVRTQMKKDGVNDADFNLIAANKVSEESYSRYCQISIKFMSNIGKLPQSEAATVMRYIFSTRQQ